MFESFQQRCTAALGRPTPISADSHQNDQLARKQASNTVQYKSGTGSVLLQQPTGERLNPSFAQSRIVIELKGIQRLSIHGQLTHTAHKNGCGGIRSGPRAQPGVELQAT